ncbi:MAG TPA: amidohydrolase family protein [Bryobacteraceae bacterium]|nr:amidohydrolase family protein [Bryobacteraceae bacterium]
MLRILLLTFSAIGAMAQPLVDYHQHLFHPAVTAMDPDTGTVTGSELIAYLDAAGIRRALVLSVAYQFANPNRPAVQDEYAKVRAENDWTSEQVARFPDRLRGFCGFNPLRDYALQELARCAQDPQLHYGIKLHFGNSDVDLDNPEHVARLRQIFREANRRRMAIAVHMRSSITRKRPYGAKEAHVFLTELLPVVSRVPVQIAHLCGPGGYDDPAIDEALGVFVDAIARHDPRMAHVYFDISGVAGTGHWEQKSELIATRVRQLGLGRVLCGSDGAIPGNTPREQWTRFRQLPLSDAEFRTIEGNIAPYMK